MSSKAIKKVGTTEALAKYLGLSRWTVSRALNGHEDINPETSKRVLQACDDLGFQPNRMAITLRGGKSGLIGICFDELDSPVLAAKVSALQNSLRKQNLRGIIEITNANDTLRNSAISHLIGMHVEAIIFIANKMDTDHPCLKAIRKQGVPLILIDPLHCIPGIPTVILDRSESIRLSLLHLKEQGAQKFAFIGIDPQDNGYGQQRCNKLKSLLAQLEIPLENIQLIYDHKPFSTDHSAEYGIKLTRKLLNLDRELPDAIITLNDRVAMGVVHELRKNNISVPQNLLLIGHDNLESSEFFDPELSTIDQHPESMMDTACELLKKTISGTLEENFQLIKPSLIVRKSSTINSNDAV